MSEEALFWLLFNLITIIGLAYYSMMELACVSLSKIRLHYHVSKGSKRAEWIAWLLAHPSRLFGTTLLGVNVTMMVGSECSRQFYQALGYSPDIAPLTQILIVITFGELAPMFAARRHPEHVSMLGIPLLYLTAKLMRPVLLAVHGVTWLASKLLGGRSHDESDLYLNRDELQHIIEEQDTPSQPGGDEFNTMVASIFTMRQHVVRDLMQPLKPTQVIPANSSIGHLRHMLQNRSVPYLPVFQRNKSNIVGIAFPRDYIRAGDHESVLKHARSPWFIIETNGVIEVLDQFRRNNETVAVVLDNKGKAVGLLTLDLILEEMFSSSLPEATSIADSRHGVIERTFDGSATVQECEEVLGVSLHSDPDLTLAKLVSQTLGHPPQEGDHLHLEDVVAVIKEASLFEAKRIQLTTHVVTDTEESAD